MNIVRGDNMEKNFSKWAKWPERGKLPGLNSPGIYILAITTKNLSDCVFKWTPGVKYIGMTNSQAGLKGRLQQFDYTIRGKEGHGGARRFRYKHKNYDSLTKKLYVCICAIECNVKSKSPKDLRAMGEVAKLEYSCLAEYVQRYKDLPEFNDKERSPKD